MIWFSESGIIRQQVTVELTDGEGLFVFVRGDEVVLVAHPVVYNQNSIWHGLLVRTFDHNGAQRSLDTLFAETLPNTAFIAQSAFALRGDELVAGMITGEGSTTPLHDLRILRHWPDSTVVGDPNRCPLPGGSYVNNFALSVGPDESALAVIGVFRSDTTELRFTGVESTEATGGWHVQPLQTGQSLSGVSLMYQAATVYGAYTTNNLVNPENVGAFLLAFPLDEVLAADEPFPTAPRSFSLTAYPNPFNSTTRLAYSLSREAEVSLEVYDLAGRLTDRLLVGRQTAGDHTVTWSVPRLSSGMYFVRLQAGEQSETARLLLIR